MKILGIDYGDRRTGVAVSDDSEFLASGVTTVKSADMEDTALKIAEICREQGAGKIVLGLPKNMDGSEGFRADHTRNFGQALVRLLPDVKIIYYDERMTTMAAAEYMNITDVRGKKRKDSIDLLAAKIILQDYLDSKQ